MKTLQEKLDLAAKAVEPVLAELLNEVDEKTDYELEQELQEQFDEYINDSHDPVMIAGILFYPADILKECDPIAYRVFLNDFESYLENE
jgi:hypothetical protein